MGKKQKANGAAATSTPKSAAKAKTPKKTDKVEETSSPAPIAPTTTPSSKKKAKRENKSKQSAKKTATATPSYLNLNLPIASFSIPMEEDTATTEKKEKVVTASDSDGAGDDEGSGSDSDAPQHKPVSKDIKSAHQHPPLPLPTSTEEGRKWKDAVIKTRAHDRYEASFDFARYKENEPDGVESWIKAKPYGQWLGSPSIARCAKRATLSRERMMPRPPCFITISTFEIFYSFCVILGVSLCDLSEAFFAFFGNNISIFTPCQLCLLLLAPHGILHVPRYSFDIRRGFLL